MRLFKVISGVVIILACNVIVGSIASAAETLWKWLPGAKGTTFTIKSGKVFWRMEGGTVLVCNNSEGFGELTEPSEDATFALAVIFQRKCNIAGVITMLSLGAENETIVTHVEIHNCLIKPGDFGLLIKYLPVHVEVAGSGILMTIEGSYIALVSKESSTHYKLLVQAQEKGSKQEIRLCEGGQEESLTVAINAEPPLKLSLEIPEDLLLFTTVQEFT